MEFIQMELRAFLILGKITRNEQKEYFKNRDPETLRNCKKLEKEFDELIDEGIKRYVPDFEAVKGKVKKEFLRVLK